MRQPQADSPGGQSPPNPARLAFFILKQVKRAVREFDMIRAGDRIAVAVSGGKDSLSLLSLLVQWRRSAQLSFDLAGIHVRGDARGITAPHGPLESWLAGQDVPYRIVEPDIGPEDVQPLECQRCTWLRRKALFLAAEQMGCHVVAFAHHADDVARTTLLNLLYTGSVWTLAPSASYFGGHFRVIRPLFYVPESELARFAQASSFPAAPPPCPRADGSRRQSMVQMLKLLGRDYLVQVRSNLIRAGLRGLADAPEPHEGRDALCDTRGLDGTSALMHD